MEFYWRAGAGAAQRRDLITATAGAEGKWPAYEDVGGEPFVARDDVAEISEAAKDKLDRVPAAVALPAPTDHVLALAAILNNGGWRRPALAIDAYKRRSGLLSMILS